MLRYSLPFVFVLLATAVDGQVRPDSAPQDTALLRAYGARFFSVGGCCPQASPRDTAFAEFYRDTSLWEWVPLNIEGLDQKTIYGLKPQYKDTLVRSDGSVVEVPVWVKYPGWKKEN